MDKKLAAFKRLLNIMDELRTQCPWDMKQTIQSLRHLTIEETYELTDAILEEDNNEIKGELGDLLLHIVFYSILICPSPLRVEAALHLSLAIHRVTETEEGCGLGDAGTPAGCSVQVDCMDGRSFQLNPRLSTLELAEQVSL